MMFLKTAADLGKLKWKKITANSFRLLLAPSRGSKEQGQQQDVHVRSINSSVHSVTKYHLPTLLLLPLKEHLKLRLFQQLKQPLHLDTH